MSSDPSNRLERSWLCNTRALTVRLEGVYFWALDWNIYFYQIFKENSVFACQYELSTLKIDVQTHAKFTSLDEYRKNKRKIPSWSQHRHILTLFFPNLFGCHHRFPLHCCDKQHISVHSAPPLHSLWSNGLEQTHTHSCACQISEKRQKKRGPVHTNMCTTLLFSSKQRRKQRDLDLHKRKWVIGIWYPCRNKHTNYSVPLHLQRSTMNFLFEFHNLNFHLRSSACPSDYNKNKINFTTFHPFSHFLLLICDWVTKKNKLRRETKTPHQYNRHPPGGSEVVPRPKRIHKPSSKYWICQRLNHLI